MNKTSQQMREEILALKSKKEVINYIDENQELYELDATSSTNINLLSLAEICGGIPGSFEFAMSNLRNNIAL